MHWWRASVSRVAAGFGVLALACNAAIPIALAFLLSASLAPAQQDWIRLGDGEWRFYGPLCHHDAGDRGADHQSKSPGAPCPVCSLHGALAIAPPTPVATPDAPIAIATAQAPSIALAAPRAVFRAAYHSRAPPLV